MHRALGNPCRDASGSPTLRRVTAIRSRQASNPLVVDTLLALALTGLSIIALLAGARDIGSYAPESIALLLLQTLPIAFRRIAPLPVLVVTLAATIVHALLATESLNTTLGSLIALFTVAERCDRRTSIVAGLAMGGSFAALLVTQAGVPASLGSLVQTRAGGDRRLDARDVVTRAARLHRHGRGSGGSRRGGSGGTGAPGGRGRTRTDRPRAP